MDDLYSLDPIRQISAISQIQDEDNNLAIPYLIELLSSSDKDVKFCAIEALGHLADTTDELVGDALMKTLINSDSISKSEILDILSDLGYKPATGLVVNLLLNDLDWLVRVSAAEALSCIANKGDIGVISALELALDDPIEPVRSFSACAIGILAISESRLINKLEVYFTSEESMGTKAEILGAKYRLGVQEDLMRILKLLVIAEDDDILKILNAINDLVTRSTPVSIGKNLKYIREYFSELLNKNSQYHRKCEEIIHSIAILI